MSNWSDILEADLTWRESELASLKRMAIVNSGNDVIHNALLRAAWTLLYAHFEGFTKFCWEALLDKVEKEQISVNKLSDEFTLLALEKKFRTLRGNTASPSLWEFCVSIFPKELESPAFFSSDCRLETDSNLWPDVYERECARIGIVSGSLDNHRVRLRALVSRRNDIAHGKIMIVRSVQEYAEYENATLVVMHELAIQTMELVDGRKYEKVK